MVPVSSGGGRQRSGWRHRWRHVGARRDGTPVAGARWREVENEEEGLANSRTGPSTHERSGASRRRRGGVDDVRRRCYVPPTADLHRMSAVGGGEARQSPSWGPWPVEMLEVVLGSGVYGGGQRRGGVRGHGRRQGEGKGSTASRSIFL